MKGIGRVSILFMSFCVILVNIHGSVLAETEPNNSVSEANKKGEEVINGNLGEEDYGDYFDLQGDKFDREKWDDIEISVTLGYSTEMVYVEVVSVNQMQMPDQVVNVYVHTPGETKTVRVKNQTIPDQFYLMVTGYGNYSIKIDYKNAEEREAEQSNWGNCGLWPSAMILASVSVLVIIAVVAKRLQ